MKAATGIALLGALLAEAAPTDDKRDVDTRFPYLGPAVPIGDWVDPTINGNGKGFPRLVEPPAVKPAGPKPKNNVNVIQLSYVPSGINLHYQTPFGLGAAPTVHWGTHAHKLHQTSRGSTNTYDRTPPCSEVAVTQCSQFFHNVQLPNLAPDTTYYYQIPAANGTTASQVLSFRTARVAGDTTPFTMAVLNDMGYTNAGGTYKQLLKAADEGLSFAWHGGDLSYADDWYSGILPCESDWPVCYNGSSTYLPKPNGTGPADIPVDDPSYADPLPAGEIADQGGAYGGDMSVLYESNWDLWQNWMSKVTMKIPYMVMLGNHEAACAEFDGPGNPLTAYLNSNITNGTAPETELTYYSCPPSQRNFTAYQNRFRMPGKETGGQTNFWYSYDYGLAHFISLDSETDFPYSPSYPFFRDLEGNETFPMENETYVTDAGPFGYINGSWKVNEAYEQYNWLKKDLASIDRTKTPWVIAMSHRPMYSSAVSSYQKNLRNAWQSLMLEYGVDAYLAGHIHWYERMYPLTANGSIDAASVLNNNTYLTNEGTSMTHLTNGMAGNVESHSTLPWNETLPITAYLDQSHYGFGKFAFLNATVATWSMVRGVDGSVGDEVTLIKKGANVTTSSGYGQHVQGRSSKWEQLGYN
ncbi:hypothetical protein LTR36_002462 [Oleoguttula mirabilis]|uniref:Purple acid phosphatase n=1 Tax=Oleoguttula mirabilis TaxID=1507867 RepID=A0AAV9JLQ0_9PEZI|nr:hypothetical protein LTR36_002462 [Oleoguttula mirabilis]